MRNWITLVVLFWGVVFWGTWCNGQEIPPSQTVTEPVVSASEVLPKTGGGEEGVEPLPVEEEVQPEIVESESPVASDFPTKGEADEQGLAEQCDNQGQSEEGEQQDEEVSSAPVSSPYNEGWLTSILARMSIKLGVLVLFALIAVVVLGLVCCMFCKSPETRTRIIALESVLAFLLVLLICIGTYHLITQIIQMNDGGHILEEMNVKGYDKSVLKAYEQLSVEMERWFALFAVLGTFFGLGVPVGSYLLQIKAVDRHEKSVQSDMKETFEKTKMQLENVEKKAQDSEERLTTAVNQIDHSLQTTREQVEELVENSRQTTKKQVEELVENSRQTTKKQVEEFVENKTSQIEKQFAVRSNELNNSIQRIWKQQEINARLMVRQLALNTIAASLKKERDVICENSLIYWSIILERCANNANDEKAMKGATRALYDIFRKIHETLKDWDKFVQGAQKVVEAQGTEVAFQLDANELSHEEQTNLKGWLTPMGITLSFKSFE